MAKVLEKKPLGTAEPAPGEESARHRTPTRRGLLIVAALAVLAVAVAVTGYLLSRDSEESATIAVDFDVESSYVPDPSQELESGFEYSTGPVSSYIPADPSREIEMALTEAQRASSYVPPADELGMALTEPMVRSARPASSYVPAADELGMALSQESVAAPADDVRFR
jgi:hypothetical protein